jgi:hypothetical protein
VVVISAQPKASEQAEYMGRGALAYFQNPSILRCWLTSSNKSFPSKSSPLLQHSNAIGLEVAALQLIFAAWFAGPPRGVGTVLAVKICDGPTLAELCNVDFEGVLAANRERGES